MRAVFLFVFFWVFVEALPAVADLDALCGLVVDLGGSVAFSVGWITSTDGGSRMDSDAEEMEESDVVVFVGILN